MVNTLKGKISLVYIGLVFLIAVVGFTGFFNLYRLEKTVNNLMTANYKSISALTNAFEAIERQDSAMLIYISVDRQKGINLFTQSSTNFLKWFSIEENNITELGESDIVEGINNNYGTFVKLFSELQEVRNTNGEDASVAFYDNKIMPIFNKLKLQLRNLININEKAMFNSKTLANNNTKRSMNMLLLLSGLTIIGGLVLSIYFIKIFLGPLQKLSNGISKIKGGELYHHLDINTNDETGKLAEEFNQMTKRLKNYEQSTLGSLMAEKNKTMAIVKSISSPMLVLDNNYRIVLINNACENYFSISEENVLGKHFLEAIRNGEIFDHISGTIENSHDHNEKIIKTVKSDDEENFYNVVVSTINDDEEQPISVIVTMQNVTELKELEKVKTDFIATISHEFKTPLTSIMMAASMLSEDGMGELNEVQKETVETIKEDGEKLSNLVSELLELSRIESGNAIYDFSPCSINLIVNESINNFISIAQKRDINLINELEIDLPLINADFEKIKWVMNNLISNALKYTNSGDFINIKSRIEKNYVFISVEDTGDGIPKEYIQKIFNKFVQVKGRDIEVRGTGLGLSVAKEIITSHKGKIWAESELDAGSIFTFSLPTIKREK
ncbi:MAG TPA: ATP-binding protein [Pseudobacteroides sp.]|uniref:HAMP domain-containing sensor histidine kinase n=1 Tax=Pseudobacteroides sp. TaxID=1968840 RepID=UPI002F933ECE